MPADKILKQAVLDELKWDPSVDAAHIGVTAKDGIITLMGTVATYAEKHAAEHATLRVKAVKAVADEIEVKLPSHVVHGDAEIADAAVNRLAWNVSVPKDSVKISVTKGWVTLTGTVEWRYQHDAAADAVRTLWGVTGVANQITIKPKVSANNIKAAITDALDRSWSASEHIQVNTQDGVVTLTGEVDHWDERALAATTAWAAPGVTAVFNHIRVV